MTDPSQHERQLSELLESADPVRGPRSRRDSSVERLDDSWTRLTARRRRTRRVLRLASVCAASGVIAVAVFVQRPGAVPPGAVPPVASINNGVPSTSATIERPDSSEDIDPAVAVPDPAHATLSTNRQSPAMRSAVSESVPSNHNDAVSRSNDAVSRSNDAVSRSNDGVESSRPVPIRDPEPIDWLRGLAMTSGDRGTPSWRFAVERLVELDQTTQRRVIDLVPRISEPELRKRAMELVVDASGPVRQSILRLWSRDPAMRPDVIAEAVSSATPEQWSEWIPVATSELDYFAFCSALVAHPNELAVDLLLDRARDGRWRAAVQSAAGGISATQLVRVIRVLDSSDLDYRTAAAFVLASIPGDQTDLFVARLILSGRFQRRAFVALLVRDTPAAQAFLTRAAARSDLSAALPSARLRFDSVRAQLQRWITNTRGDSHETIDTGKLDFTDGRHLLVAMRRGRSAV